MNPFKWLWTYLRKHKFHLILAFGLVIVFTLLNLIPPYTSGVIVDRVIIGREMELLWPLLILVVAVTMVKAVTRYFYRWTFERISQDVVYNVRMNLYQKLQELDFYFFDRTRTGDLMTRMSGDADAVRHFISWVAFSLVENITLFLLSLAILFSINPQLALALLVWTPVIGFFTLRLSMAVKPTFFAIPEQLSRLNSVVQENISGNWVVKAFAREEYEIAKFTTENDNFKAANLKAVQVWSKFLPLIDATAGGLTVVLLLVGGLMVMKGRLTMGELVMFNSFLWTLIFPLRNLGWLINDLQRFVAGATKIIALLTEQPRIKNMKTPRRKESLEGKVEFRNVSFALEDQAILQEISFTAHPGAAIARSLVPPEPVKPPS